jgi:hypothetical protein
MTLRWKRYAVGWPSSRKEGMVVGEVQTPLTRPDRQSANNRRDPLHSTALHADCALSREARAKLEDRFLIHILLQITSLVRLCLCQIFSLSSDGSHGRAKQARTRRAGSLDT